MKLSVHAKIILYHRCNNDWWSVLMAHQHPHCPLIQLTPDPVLWSTCSLRVHLQFVCSLNTCVLIQLVLWCLRNSHCIDIYSCHGKLIHSTLPSLLVPTCLAEMFIFTSVCQFSKAINVIVFFGITCVCLTIRLIMSIIICSIMICWWWSLVDGFLFGNHHRVDF